VAATCAVSGARVVDVEGDSGDLLVSSSAPAASSSSLLGFGFTRISRLAPTHAAFVGAHSAPVRDVRWSDAQRDTILTASFDRSLALTSLRTLAPVLRIGLSGAAWACSWLPQRPFLVAAGLSGEAALFDIRCARPAPLWRATLSSPQPVHSLVPWANGDAVELVLASSAGVFVASLPPAVAGGGGGREGEVEAPVTAAVTAAMPLPLPTRERSATSLAFDAASGAFALSLRRRARLGGDTAGAPALADAAVLCFSLRSGGGEAGWEATELRELSGHTCEALMPRVAVFSLPTPSDKAVFAACGDERERALHVWHVSSGCSVRSSRRPHPTPVLDVRFDAARAQLVSVSQECVQILR
jgi:WD40 repeat protein